MTPAASLLCALLANAASAGGFAITEQSASAAAHASVGATAGLPDASTAFYNPATITLLRQPEVQVGVGVGFPRFRYSDDGTTDAIGSPMRGDTSTDMGTWIVPGLFAVFPIGSRFAVGVAVTSPFGDSTGYDSDWVGRYFVTDIRLETVDVSPLIAWKVDENWSIGAGIDWQRARLSKNSSVDFGSVCFGILDPASCQGLGLVPQSVDGRVQLSGTNSAWGYNAGVMYKADDIVRIGFNYRSKVTHDFHGMARFDVPAAAVPLLQTGAFQNTAARTSLVFPESADLAVAYRTSEALTVYASVNWTRWSRVRDYLVVFDNPAQPAELENLGWEDTTRVGVAVDYKLDDALTLSSGLAYDPSPIPADRRQAILPNSDTLVLGAGLAWNINRSVYVRASYNHYFMHRAGIEESAPAAGTLRGTYSNALQGVGISCGARF